MIDTIYSKCPACEAPFDNGYGRPRPQAQVLQIYGDFLNPQLTSFKYTCPRCEYFWFERKENTQN